MDVRPFATSQKKMEKVRINQGYCGLSKTVQECRATLTGIWLSVLPGPCRLPSIHRLNLQQVGAFSLTVKHRLCVDESQFWVNAKIFVVPAAILKQRVGDLCGGVLVREFQVLKCS